MSFTVKRTLSGIQKQQLNRLKRTLLEGSPKYHYDVPVIAAGVSVGFDVFTQFPRAQKYEPLDSIIIINNDVVNISVELNGAGGDLLIVPAGTIREAGRSEIGAIRRILVTNDDAVVAVVADMIDIELWRAPEDINSIARHETFGGNYR
ncbi:MAG: hypothetical protein CMI54_02290 [Parcubacteria group bacterium]|nr:hypothetical protein [Parcubacteria group bacterium]|tara:strand:+ start:2224 stop:2670 length:447 start_codon:yes stop_codon:yes gene_type:complete